MGRLLLMRHGESEGNRDRVFTRTPEVPITETGCAQARAAAEWIAARYRPTRVVCSPFRRARQTAEIVAEVLATPIEVEPDLRERSYGDLAGLPYSAARSLTTYDPAVYWEWCPPGGGETLVEVATRAGAVLDRVVRSAPDHDVVVVSHGAVMIALLRHLTGEWGVPRAVRNTGLIVAEHSAGVYGRAQVIEAGRGPGDGA
jgi:probable phosphoglycerate mutase